MPIRFLTIVSVFILLVSCNKSETKHIQSAVYFGSDNPVVNKDAGSVDINLNRINSLFDYLKRAKAYPVKGKLRYLTIKTGNSLAITLEILPTKPYPMRVIKENRITSMWYEFKDQKHVTEWNSLLKELDNNKVKAAK